MATTKDDIRLWLERGKEKNATHVLVVCDTFDWEDYPVYVSSQENPQEVYDRFHGKNMQKVMEVYSLSKDVENQLSEHRVMNFD
jgi:transposase